MGPALLLVLAMSNPPPPASATAEPRFLKERLGNHAVAQLFAPGVADLSPADKKVAWHLTLAGHAGEDIQYDQLGWKNVALKRLLEGVYLFGTTAGAFEPKLIDYLTRFYGHTGNHDGVTGQKFVPTFTFDELKAAAQRALKAGAPWK